MPQSLFSQKKAPYKAHRPAGRYSIRNEFAGSTRQRRRPASGARARLVANGVHEVELATGFAFAGSRS
ncbi:MAG: hypothetical protein V3U55_09515, partial [Mycobacterium sp.]